MTPKQAKHLTEFHRKHAAEAMTGVHEEGLRRAVTAQAGRVSLRFAPVGTLNPDAARTLARILCEAADEAEELHRAMTTRLGKLVRGKP